MAFAFPVWALPSPGGDSHLTAQERFLLGPENVDLNQDREEQDIAQLALARVSSKWSAAPCVKAVWRSVAAHWRGRSSGESPVRRAGPRAGCTRQGSRLGLWQFAAEQGRDAATPEPLRRATAAFTRW